MCHLWKQDFMFRMREKTCLVRTSKNCDSEILILKSWSMSSDVDDRSGDIWWQGHLGVKMILIEGHWTMTGQILIFVTICWYRKMRCRIVRFPTHALWLSSQSCNMTTSHWPDTLRSCLHDISSSYPQVIMALNHRSHRRQYDKLPRALW